VLACLVLASALAAAAALLVAALWPGCGVTPARGGPPSTPRYRRILTHHLEPWPLAHPIWSGGVHLRALNSNVHHLRSAERAALVEGWNAHLRSKTTKERTTVGSTAFNASWFHRQLAAGACDSPR